MDLNQAFELALGPLGALVVLLVFGYLMYSGRLRRGSECDMWKEKYWDLHERHIGELEKKREISEVLEKIASRIEESK